VTLPLLPTRDGALGENLYYVNGGHPRTYFSV
jgi:hypothetical protein